MKIKTNYAFVIPAILILMLSSGCSMKPKLTERIVFELGNEIGIPDSLSAMVTDINKIDETVDIIQKRLNSYGISHQIERNPATNDYTLWLPEKINIGATKRLISTVGKIEIWETWNIFTGGPPQPDDSIYKFINYSSSRLTPLLVPRKEVNEVENMMKRYAKTKQWPQNIKYAWGQKPADEKGDVYELYMLRSANNPQSPVITNNHIENASYGRNQKNWIIDIVLNTAGASRFEKVTRENVGQPLAIVVDDKVYSAPVVNSPIIGGRLQVSGNFTRDDAEKFASILKYEALPLTVKIKE